MHPVLQVLEKIDLSMAFRVLELNRYPVLPNLTSLILHDTTLPPRFETYLGRICPRLAKMSMWNIDCSEAHMRLTYRERLWKAFLPCLTDVNFSDRRYRSEDVLECLAGLALTRLVLNYSKGFFTVDKNWQGWLHQVTEFSSTLIHLDTGESLPPKVTLVVSERLPHLTHLYVGNQLVFSRSLSPL